MLFRGGILVGKYHSSTLRDPGSVADYMIARTCSTMEVLETVFAGRQDFYTGLGGVTKALYSL